MVIEKEKWITTWSQAQKGIGLFPVNDNGHTVAFQIPIQNTGDQLRLTLGNYYSEQPLKIDHLTISNQDSGPFQTVTVAGEPTFTIAERGLKRTDVISLPVNCGASIYVRIYYAEQVETHRAISGNGFATSVSRSKIGDFTTEAEFELDTTYADVISNDPYVLKYGEALAQYQMRFTLTLEGVDVQTTQTGGTVVAFGDSITEQRHWVTPLQQNVAKELGEGYSVVNAGISGNRLLKEIANLPRRTQYFGLAGIDRFAHDVFEVNTNVKVVIISIGVNDLHQPGTDDQFSVSELPSFEEMVAGYEQLIKQAKDQECQVYLATISPFIGYTVAVKNDEKEAIRQQLNAWIRKHAEVDGVYDFDRVLADPKAPARLASQYDSGDKLHPSEVGGAAMSQLIHARDFLD